MTTIELDDQTAEAFRRLVARAQLNRIPLDQYLSNLADQAEVELKAVSDGAHVKRDPKEISAILDRLGRVPQGTPSLPRDFSRADLYDEER